MNINNESASAVLDFFYFNDIFIFFCNYSASLSALIPMTYQYAQIRVLFLLKFIITERSFNYENKQ